MTNKDTTKSTIDRPALSSPIEGVYSGASYQSNVRSVRFDMIATADDRVTITEPSSPEHSQYPWNKVEKSISGHLKEIDDTPGAERMLEMHRSGTYTEIHPDGTKVTKMFGDDFYICLQDHNLIVGGNLNITVQGNANLLVKGDLKQKIDGDLNTIVNGNHSVRVKGNYTHYTEGTIDIQSRKSLFIKAGDDIVFNGRKNFNVDVFGGINLVASNTIKLFSDSIMSLNAISIENNSPNTKPKIASIKDKDIGVGLTVSDSVVSPSFSSVIQNASQNVNIITSNDDSNTQTFPKDRKENL